MNYERSRFVNYGLLVLFSFLFFGPYLDIGFLSDNIAHIQKSWENLFNFKYYYYRPLSVLTLYLDQKIWGVSAAGYHFTNVVIHFFNAVLVYRLALLFKPQQRETALTASILFLVHPIHSLNVFWISGRTDMVCSFFFLLSLYFVLRWLRGSSKFGLFWGGLLFLSALLSKEMALSAPFVLLLALWYERRWNVETGTKLLTPFILIIALVFGFRLLMGNHDLLSNEMHNALNPFVLVKNAAIYLGLLLVPGGHEEIALFLRLHSYLFLPLTVIAFGITGWIFWKFRPSRAVWFWVLFTGLTLLPVLRLVMRWYLYLPSAGFAIALTFWLREKIQNTKLWLMVMIVIVSWAMGFLSYQRSLWLGAGRMATKWSKHYAHEIQEQPVKRYAVLTVPAELRDTPVFMFGFQELIWFRLNNSFQFTRRPPIYVLSRISLNDEMDLEKLQVTPIDSLTYDLSLNGTQSEFIFPNQAVFVSGSKRPHPGARITGDVAETEIKALDAAGRVQDIRIHLTDASVMLILK